MGVYVYYIQRHGHNVQSSITQTLETALISIKNKIDKLWYIHTVEHCTVMNMNKPMLQQHNDSYNHDFEHLKLGTKVFIFYDFSYVNLK